MKKILLTAFLILVMAIPAFAKTVSLGCSQNGTKFTAEIPDGCTVITGKNQIQTGPNTWTNPYLVMCNGVETGRVNKDTHLYEPYKTETVTPTTTATTTTTVKPADVSSQEASKSWLDVIIDFIKKLFGGK